MKVELIPSMVTPSSEMKGQYLTSFVINDTIAIDAGGLGFIDDVQKQSRIQDLFLSHSHLDHLASLPFLLDNIFDSSPSGIRLYAGRETLNAVSAHLFNDVIWPDFLHFQRSGQPFVRLIELEAGKPVDLEGIQVTPVAVDHVVPTLGFVLESENLAIGVSSDTGPTERLWTALNATSNLRAVFLEASFPDRMAQLAKIAKHLTPTLFASEAAKLQRDVRLIAVHIKPAHFEETRRELEALRLSGKTVEIGETGKIYTF